MGLVLSQLDAASADVFRTAGQTADDDFFTA